MQLYRDAADTTRPSAPAALGLQSLIPVRATHLPAFLRPLQVGCHNYSLLLRWPGAEDPSPSPGPGPGPAPPAPPAPVLLYSHLDVVPVANETLADWTHPPFSGAVQGGYIWGRGTLDVKVGAGGWGGGGRARGGGLLARRCAMCLTVLGPRRGRRFPGR